MTDLTTRKRGRPPKEVEQKLIEGLNKLSPLFLEKLEEALREGKPYALKIYAQCVLPKGIELNVFGDIKPEIPVIRFISHEENREEKQNDNNVFQSYR